MRHSTKRNGYHYGKAIIDVSFLLDKISNNISIINNISASVKPIGLSGSLVLSTINRKKYRIPLSELEWTISKGKFYHGNFIRNSTVVNIERISAIDLNTEYSINKNDLFELIDSLTLFMVPKQDLYHEGIPFVSVDIFFVIYFVLIIIIGSILYKFKKRSVIYE